MFCHDFFIVMSVNDPKIMFRWRGEISPLFSPLFSPHEFSWFLRKWFVKHERKCFVMTSSYMFCHDFFIVYVLSWFLHRNECKWTKNNVYVHVWQQHRRKTVMNYFWRTEGVTTSPCVTRLMNFSEKVWQHDILTTTQEINVYVNVLSWFLHRNERKWPKNNV